MRERAHTGSLASNPVTVGGMTVLITVIAVFLAYNANQSLPFVPAYHLTAQVPNADELVDGNEVRMGGLRVGTVTTVEPSQDEDGEVSARLNLTLNRDIEPLPADSNVVVRNRSPIGLKYLEIRPGDSPLGFQEGDLIPLSSAKPDSGEIDDFLNTFDDATRIGSQGNLAEFGNALAGRGPQLNEGIGELRALVESVQRPAANLASPATRLGPFWSALAATATEVAPVAEAQASLFVGLDATFGGFARVARPYLQETISKGPEGQDAAIKNLPAMRPFFRHSAEFFHELRPGAEAIANASPDLAVALTNGIPALNRSPRLNRQLAPTAQALLDFQNAPGVFTGLDLLADTNEVLDPLFHFVAPSQTVCNYLTLLFRNGASIGAQGDGIGTWTRATAFVGPEGPNSEGGPASAPADGPARPNHLHYNPYPNTAAPGQTRECEAGNEVYLRGGTVVGNVPGNQGTLTAGQGKGR